MQAIQEGLADEFDDGFELRWTEHCTVNKRVSEGHGDGGWWMVDCWLS